MAKIKFTLIAVAMFFSQIGINTLQSQETSNGSITVKATKKGEYFSGFEVFKGAKSVSIVGLSSDFVGLVAKKCSVNKSQNALEFSGFSAKENAGIVFGENDAIRVRLIKGDDFPEVSFDITVVKFDADKWGAVVGKEPFHFLSLYLPEAEVWHQRGWLNATPVSDPFPLLLDQHVGTPEISAYHYNRNWSYTVALGGHPIPVIGLWAPKVGRYVAFEFQTTRLEDNSERDVATGYRWVEGSENSSRQFVALVYPYGGQGYQKLVFPENGSHISSRCRLLWSMNLKSIDDPNEFVLSYVWQQAKEKLPSVPAVADVSWIPGGIRLKDFQGAPRGGVIGGNELPFSGPGTRIVVGWTWHNESPTAAPASLNDARRIQSFKDQANELLKYAKRFQVNGEDCVFWEKPIEGQWTEEWGGKAVTTLHNANGFAAGRVFLGLYRDAGMKEYLPIVNGVLNWAKYITWTRNEFADVPSSPFAIGGTLSASFCLEYYMTFKTDPDSQRRAMANTALKLARSFTYRYMVMWLSDNNRFDNLNSAFLWEPNSGRDWTAAACANEVFWNLDTLAQTAVHTGDPILMWALQGSLDRWHQLYQDVVKDDLSQYQARDMTEGYGLYPGNVYGFGKRAAYGFAAPLVMTEPVGNSSIRVLAGEKAALAFRKMKQAATVASYKYSPDGNLAFVITSEKPQFDLSLTVPYCDISRKLVSIVRGGKKIALKAGEDFTRQPQALWSLYLKNIKSGDKIIVGEVNENSPVLPSSPPIASTSEGKITARDKKSETGFNIVSLPYDSAVDNGWDNREGWAGLPVGKIWVFGIPFQIAPLSEKSVVKNQAKLSIKGIDYVYLLYSDGDGAAPVLIYSDGSKDTSRIEALAWRSWPPLFTGRLILARIQIPKGKSIESINPSGRLVWAMTTQKISDTLPAATSTVESTVNKAAQEWKEQKAQELVINGLKEKVASLPENKIGILPPSPGGPAHKFFQQIGLLNKSVMISNDKLVDKSFFNPKNIPVAIYLDGEDYVYTVKSAGDGAAAIEQYLNEGGMVVLLASQPWPMFYATGTGPRKADALTGKLGLPLSMALEGTPSEKLNIKINPQQSIIKANDVEFPFPEGDTRLRAILRSQVKAKYTPIATVVGDAGKDYGDAAGLIEFPNGSKILYIAHILQNDPKNGFEIRKTVAEYLVELLRK